MSTPNIVNVATINAKNATGAVTTSRASAVDVPADKVAKIKQGHAIFFASFIRHRVKPVIKGNRKSLVMWFGGTPFK